VEAGAHCYGFTLLRLPRLWERRTTCCRLPSKLRGAVIPCTIVVANACRCRPPYEKKAIVYDTLQDEEDIETNTI
jgi:hypothetical protein